MLPSGTGNRQIPEYSKYKSFIIDFNYTLYGRGNRFKLSLALGESGWFGSGAYFSYSGNQFIWSGYFTITSAGVANPNYVYCAQWNGNWTTYFSLSSVSYKVYGTGISI